MLLFINLLNSKFCSTFCCFIFIFSFIIISFFTRKIQLKQKHFLLERKTPWPMNVIFENWSSYFEIRWYFNTKCDSYYKTRCLLKMRQYNCRYHKHKIFSLFNSNLKTDTCFIDNVMFFCKDQITTLTYQ